MLEIPITTLNLCGRNLPIAGGGYFRLFPYGVTRWGLRHINRQEGRPFVFYLHPWELDPEQPRMLGASRKSRLRHYLNLDKTEGRFRRLLAEFSFSPVREVLQMQQIVDTASISIAAAAMPAKVRIGHAHTSG
jgi:polysaccharide deacetylase family protein (PEP-CTERM system associated)